MKEIGGFFELELNKNSDYYSDAIKLNTGRNALLYIIKAKNIKKIYLPFYICDAIVNIIIKAFVDFEFYNIDKNFNPIFDKPLKDNEYFLYVNYFGINEDKVKFLKTEYKNLIIDNSQAFFCPPEKNVDTIYSARKFFGVADGAYLCTDTILDKNIEQDYSYCNYEHLLKRIDINAKESYKQYIQNENNLQNTPLKYMSNLTSAILKNIDYKKIKLKREENFLFFHKHLKDINELNIDVNSLNGPLVYPFLISKNKFSEFLIKNNIYVACYWKEVLNRVNDETLEAKFTNFIIPLPVDQRIDNADIEFIVRKINFFLKTFYNNITL